MGRIKEEETFVGCYYLHNEAARPPLRLLLFKGADFEKFSVQVLLIELNKKPQLITYCFSASPRVFVFNTAFYTHELSADFLTGTESCYASSSTFRGDSNEVARASCFTGILKNMIRSVAVAAREESKFIIIIMNIL